MKKRGVLHAELAGLIASMGHHDLLVIGDAGLPVPNGVAVIDLAVTAGVPGFLVTLSAVLDELAVESAVIDREQAELSPKFRKQFDQVWPADIPLREVPHAELQEMAKGARAVVRTGEFTPYANIVLVAGVVF